MDVEQEQRFIIDRIGEETDLEECSLCFASSCFSCISDHCVALKKLSDGGCVFYKDYEENHKDIWRCFYRLIRCQRFDLLMKYADNLTALGLMDQEIDMAEMEHEWLEKHRGDHLPNVTDQTLFESGRLKIIPFTRHFTDAEQDKTLKTTLMKPENLSGILNWAIEGYRLFKAEGLPEPDEVKAATEQYKVDSDRTAQFMAQCLKHEKGAELKSTTVYSRYKDWCNENGYKYEGAQNFYKRLGLEYQIVKRHPWKVETTGNKNMTILIDDIAWATGEEPELPVVPEE